MLPAPGFFMSGALAGPIRTRLRKVYHSPSDAAVEPAIGPPGPNI